MNNTVELIYVEALVHKSRLMARYTGENEVQVKIEYQAALHYYCYVSPEESEVPTATYTLNRGMIISKR